MAKLKCCKIVLVSQLRNSNKKMSIRFQNILSRVEVAGQLKRPGIGGNASCASELLHFETLHHHKLWLILLCTCLCYSG